MKRMIVVLLALLACATVASAQNSLLLDVSDTRLKGLTWATDRSNAECAAREASKPEGERAKCDETPAAYAERALLGVLDEYYAQALASFDADLKAAVQKARDANDEATLDAVAALLKVARPEKPKAEGELEPR